MANNETLWDFGTLKWLRIVCISEIGWFDTQTLVADVKAAGGMMTDQYQIQWTPLGHLHPDNAAGFSALIEAEEIGGIVHKVLFDAGWGTAWMNQRLAKEGVDTMLQRGEIESLVISHEHFDHFWGIGTILQYCPEITIYLPAGFHAQGSDFIKNQGHEGQIVIVESGQPFSLFPGLGLVHFSTSTLFQVKGENVLYGS